MSKDTYSDYSRYAGPRCYECGARGHTHLRCPGATQVVKHEPATMVTGTLLIDFAEVEGERNIGSRR